MNRISAKSTSLEDGDKMRETAYLPGNPANAERLRISVADA